MSKDTLDSFIVDAVEQGRNLYVPGTPERQVIDNIPTEPAT